MGGPAPGARERHQTAQHTYQQAHQRHQSAEQTYETTLTQDLVNAAAVAPPGARRWPQPGDPPEPEHERPARRIERGREGPSFGL